MLALKGLSSGYGDSIVLDSIDVDVHPGEVVSVLGSNGAGKTTLLRTISGLIPARAGTIVLNERDLQGSTPANIVRAGIAHVPEGRRIFPGLTVLENLIMGAFTIDDKKVIGQNLETIFELFPRLAERRKQVGTTLSGGEQQMLSVGRALMSSPRFLLLDEPSMGLAPVIVERLFDSLKVLRTKNLGILLVEQNASVALDVADRFIVLSRGKIVRAGTRSENMSPCELISAYLAD